MLLSIGYITLNGHRLRPSIPSSTSCLRSDPPLIELSVEAVTMIKWEVTWITRTCAITAKLGQSSHRPLSTYQVTNNIRGVITNDRTV